MVNCSVCGARLASASENEGPFQATGSFLGGRITDTCDRCAATLRVAVTKAANEIWLRVEERRKARAAEAERDARAAKKFVRTGR